MKKENIEDCPLCEDDELAEINQGTTHVICEVCGFCRKYHCDCDY